MSTEYVIGVDSSTQSTKVIAWSKSGEVLEEGRAPIPMSNPQPDQFEQEPADWWTSFCTAVRELGQCVDLRDALGIAISIQRETVGFLDNQHNSLRPGMVWLDERARDLTQKYCEIVPSEKIHQLTGKPVNVTPVLYRLYWMRLNEPEILDETAYIVDVQGFLAGKLTGKITTSWTGADPWGIFDITKNEWSRTILDPIGIKQSQMPPAVASGSCIGNISTEAKEQTGLKIGTPLYAAGGDGQCAGLGVNAMKPGTGYLNLGTALVIGAWDESPKISRSWRTVISPTNSGYFLEGVVRAGTYFVDWFMKKFVNENPSSEDYLNLENHAAEISIGSQGLLVSPYLSGCMNPYWTADVRASFFGLSTNHGPAHIYRAILESLTGTIARCVNDMRKEGIELDHIISVGGGANSELWLQMVADATGLPVRVSKSLEASALGAGITAAKGIGWFPDFETAADAMCQSREGKLPVESNYSVWKELLEKQQKLNDIMVAEHHLNT